MKRRDREGYAGHSLWFHLSVTGDSDKAEPRDVRVFSVDFLWLNYSNHLVSSSLLQAPCICANRNASSAPLVFPNLC